MLVFQARVIHMIPCFSRRRYTLMTGKDPSLTLTLFDKTNSQHLKICTSRFLETGELPMFQQKKTSIFGQTSGRSCSNNPRYKTLHQRPPATGHQATVTREHRLGNVFTLDRWANLSCHGKGTPSQHLQEA